MAVGCLNAGKHYTGIHYITKHAGKIYTMYDPGPVFSYCVGLTRNSMYDQIHISMHSIPEHS